MSISMQENTLSVWHKPVEEELSELPATKCFFNPQLEIIFMLMTTIFERSNSWMESIIPVLSSIIY